MRVWRVTSEDGTIVREAPCGGPGYIAVDPGDRIELVDVEAPKVEGDARNLRAAQHSSWNCCVCCKPGRVGALFWQEIEGDISRVFCEDCACGPREEAKPVDAKALAAQLSQNFPTLTFRGLQTSREIDEIVAAAITRKAAGVAECSTWAQCQCAVIYGAARQQCSLEYGHGGEHLMGLAAGVAASEPAEDTCSRCGQTYARDSGHKWGAAGYDLYCYPKCVHPPRVPAYPGMGIGDLYAEQVRIMALEAKEWEREGLATRRLKEARAMAWLHGAGRIAALEVEQVAATEQARVYRDQHRAIAREIEERCAAHV